MTSFQDEARGIADWAEQQWDDERYRAAEAERNRELLANLAGPFGITDDELVEAYDELAGWLRESHSPEELVEVARNLAERNRE